LFAEGSLRALSCQKCHLEGEWKYPMELVKKESDMKYSLTGGGESVVDEGG